jgi:hypothetical protein
MHEPHEVLSRSACVGNAFMWQECKCRECLHVAGMHGAGMHVAGMHSMQAMQCKPYCTSHASGKYARRRDGWMDGCMSPEGRNMVRERTAKG